MPTIAERNADVLVLGGGFAGVRCAQRLERLLPKDRTITLVASENYFVFQPLLPEVVGASLSPTHVISPLRHLLRRTHVVRGDIGRIDLAAPDAAVAGSATVTADGVEEAVRFTAQHLVLALGSIVDTSRIPGMAEHALQMKNVADALQLRHTILTRLERAMLEPDAADRAALLTFVVVGGGFSGIETAAEINDLVRSGQRFFPALRGETIRVVCVHARDRVLPELDARLGAHALKVLRKRGIEFRLSAKTRAVSPQGVYLADGELIAARTVVSTVGNAPHPLLKSLATADTTGRLPTDEMLRLLGHKRVWAIGDCAANPDGYGATSPPTAQFAGRAGDVAGRNIDRALRGKPLQPFRHKSQGQLATLGHMNAVAAIGPFRITGVLAWWMWRTIYLAKLPRLERKLRVVIDWTLNMFFPRDLNALAIGTTQGHNKVHLEAGETLFHQGDPSAAFYVVESGRVQLIRCDASGACIGSDLLGPGEHFGEGSLLRGGVRATTAVAMESTTVLRFAAREFSSLTRCFTGLRKLLESSSRRFQPASSIVPAWVPPERLELPVRDVMTKTVLTLPPDTTLRHCLEVFLAKRFNAFPLADANGKLAGLVTSSDLFGALRRDVDLDQPLLAIATVHVQCVSADEPMARAIEIMRRRDVKHVVVTDAQHVVVGIVSIKDVIARMLADAPAAVR